MSILEQSSKLPIKLLLGAQEEFHGENLTDTLRTSSARHSTWGYANMAVTRGTSTLFD